MFVFMGGYKLQSFGLFFAKPVVVENVKHDLKNVF